MSRLAVFVLLVRMAFSAGGQAPNLSEAAELWRGQIHGVEARVLQIPRRAAALIPLRFLLQIQDSAPGMAHEHAMAANHCTHCAPSSAPVGTAPSSSILSRLDHAEFTARAGAEALLAYPPTRAFLRQWSENLIEVRETFRTPGTYRLFFASETDPHCQITIPVEVGAFGYLKFGEEFGFFVIGCGVLGSVLLGLILWLHRRGRSQPRATGAPAPMMAGKGLSS